MGFEAAARALAPHPAADCAHITSVHENDFHGPCAAAAFLLLARQRCPFRAVSAEEYEAIVWIANGKCAVAPTWAGRITEQASVASSKDACAALCYRSLETCAGFQ